ncbi:MAG: primosomal protein N' [Tatlockia sp.]
MKTIFQVCIPHTARDHFDYCDYDLHPSIGARVWVPFGKKTRLGVVVGKINTSSVADSVIKSITALIDEKALLSEELLTLCRFVSSYYQAPLSEVLALALPKKYRLGEKTSLPRCDFFTLTLEKDKALQRIPAQAKKQQALVQFLSQHTTPVSKPALQKEGFNPLQWNALLTAGVIAKSQEVILWHTPHAENDRPLPLNDEQQSALNTMSQSQDSYACFLLQGVTGSGKTEVYLQLIEKVLAKGRQVLVLVPEIGLTPQLLARFTARFNEPMVVMHSNLNESERQIAWQLACDNLVKLVIGTRSAVFSPLPHLGLIVIDEEHDASLKQMEGVRYFARDTALMRAFLANIPIVLGSATPSLESLYNCTQQKYQLLRLTQKALSQTPLFYQLVDIRSVPLQEGLAPATLQAIATHLEAGNQVLVFINRRGFAPVLLCHQCGFIVDCQACDSHLTMHRKSGRMICHHCGVTKPIPQRCAHCQSTELLALGSGTQRIEEYLQSQFQDTAILRIDRDEVRRKNALDAKLERINKGDAQLIVGTQMLAKGHHFPRLTLVVVLDADAGFYNPDFRALERLGQLLTQVAGRAGRAQFEGQVLIQTHLPEHPLLNLLIQQGYDAFSKALLAMREEAKLPPYHYLAVIRAQDKIPGKVLQFLHQTKTYLTARNLQVLGPAPAPLARKAEQHRMQLLIKSPSRKVLQDALTHYRLWLVTSKLTNHLRWSLDVDPMDLS